MSRGEILKNITINKPKGEFPLPEIDMVFNEGNAFDSFKEIIPKISAKLEIVSDYSEISGLIEQRFSKKNRIVNTIDSALFQGIDIAKLDSIKDLNLLDLAIIKGDMAVAENGSIWVSDKNLPHRILPFICENLVLVIDKKDIINNMHEAYKLQNDLDYNYGVFIAGPSKTADIEQSLVVGAQGPRNLMVIVVEK
ncbi:MAG: LUD domain-containing protein [Bacteroidota bacterium]